MSSDLLEQRVLRAAYEWRYALVTPGADLDAARSTLVDAVDELDIDRAYAADADETQRAGR